MGVGPSPLLCRCVRTHERRKEGGNSRRPCTCTAIRNTRQRYKKEKMRTENHTNTYLLTIIRRNGRTRTDARGKRRRKKRGPVEQPGTQSTNQGEGCQDGGTHNPPTSSEQMRQLVQKILRHYIGTFLPQRCTLCDERRWVLAKCHSNFEWWCLQCGISLQDSTHNGLPPSDSVHCGSSRGPSSHCEYSSAS